MQCGHKGSRGHSLSTLRGLWKGTCKAVVIKPSGPRGTDDGLRLGFSDPRAGPSRPKSAGKDALLPTSNCAACHPG